MHTIWNVLKMIFLWNLNSHCIALQNCIWEKVSENKINWTAKIYLKSILKSLFVRLKPIEVVKMHMEMQLCAKVNTQIHSIQLWTWTLIFENMIIDALSSPDILFHNKVGKMLDSETDRVSIRGAMVAGPRWWEPLVTCHNIHNNVNIWGQDPNIDYCLNFTQLPCGEWTRDYDKMLQAQNISVEKYFNLNWRRKRISSSRNYGASGKMCSLGMKKYFTVARTGPNWHYLIQNQGLNET